MMEERKKILSMWIGNRVKDNEIAKCMFDITVPKLEEMLYENEYIKKCVRCWINTELST